MSDRAFDVMASNKCRLFAKAALHENSYPVDSASCCISDGNAPNATLEIGPALWTVVCHTANLSDGIIDVNMVFHLQRGNLENCNVSLGLEFDGWSKDNYVVMPAGVYAGNRFDSRKLSYPPILSDEDTGVNIPVIITDVPRLNIHDGESRIQLMTRDLSTPAVGFQDAARKKGFWLLTEQCTLAGDTGITLEENEDRSMASITLSCPGIRNGTRYVMCSTEYPSEDRGFDFVQGDSVELHARLYFYDCPDIQTLFERFKDIRKDFSGEAALSHEIPFSSAWAIQEEKYNRLNWNEELGYYNVNAGDGNFIDWEIGWTGGLMVTHPLLFQGSTTTRQRVLKAFDFIFEKGGQDHSGFFFGCGGHGEWFGDFFSERKLNWHLIRKSSDALYFLIKQFMLLEKQGLACIRKSWTDGARACADAFVRLWRRYGQFGQFVDSKTGEMIIGGSASAGIAPAGLALAWQYFGDVDYINVAKLAAEYYYDQFVSKGYTTGGPGEICQCPDSESAFGLLESFVVLYETTKEWVWIDRARDMANQCLSWCVSYDFKFPAISTFGRMGMHTTGSVYANVQNKHSAPGICTLSGDSLFKLYRATGDVHYLECLQEMAHNMPQYLSREDKYIPGLPNYWIENIGHPHELANMPAGYMSERVQMSDWLEPIGEVAYLSTWPEVSNMMAFVEVPGLYIQLDTGFVCAIDHVDVTSVEHCAEGVKLKIKNPTSFHAEVKIFAETSSEMRTILGQNALHNCQTLGIAPGEEKEWYGKIGGAGA